MSTTFYALAAPVTALRVEPRGSHAHISVFIDHKLGGKLIIDANMAWTLFHLFKGPELFQRSGNSYSPPLDRFPATWQVIDEYGVLHTIADLRARTEEELT